MKIKNKPAPNRPNKRWLTVRQVQTKEGVDRMSVYYAIWHDKVAAKEVDGGWLIDTHHPLYEDWLQGVSELREKDKDRLEKVAESAKQMWATRKSELQQKLTEAKKKREDKQQSH